MHTTHSTELCYCPEVAVCMDVAPSCWIADKWPSRCWSYTADSYVLLSCIADYTSKAYFYWNWVTFTHTHTRTHTHTPQFINELLLVSHTLHTVISMDYMNPCIATNQPPTQQTLRWILFVIVELYNTALLAHYQCLDSWPNCLQRWIGNNSLPTYLCELVNIVCKYNNYIHTYVNLILIVEL